MSVTEAVSQFGAGAVLIFAMMGTAIHWLLKDRGRILALLETANADRFALREKRADDLERAANEYREFGESSREVMREWTTKAEMVLAMRHGGGG